ncbi:MAG: hypothetical protein QW835_06455 [Candidatus Hadarchaeum sp.]|uniref:hypothetical protein n=1 Tax=Candidatus Hadarchaeum sp. TaxID=2883567 RepID=UPI00316D8FBE
MKSDRHYSKGQSAVEYLTILSAALALLTSVTLTQSINPSKNAADHSAYLMQAKATASSIAGAIDAVYANGAGASKSLIVKLGCPWTAQMDNSKNVFRVIFWTMSGAENSEVNLQYKIKKQHLLTTIPPGTYTVIVTWSENKNFPETMQLDVVGGGKIYIYLNPQG